MEYYGIIYIIKNKKNNKYYVGQTTRTFNERYQIKKGKEKAEGVYEYHKYNKDCGGKYNKHLLSSFEKYGWENFIVYENFDVAYTKEELDKKERYYIKKFNSFGNGYNKTIGGQEGFSWNKVVYQYLDWEVENFYERVERISKVLSLMEENKCKPTRKIIKKMSDYLCFDTYYDCYDNSYNNENDIEKIVKESDMMGYEYMEYREDYYKDYYGEDCYDDFCEDYDFCE